jgi:hypothetical protein
MNRTAKLAFALFALLLPEGATAQRAHPPPSLPRRLEGYCEGENCGFDYRAVACSTLTLRSEDRHTAPVVGAVARGDTVVVTTGNISVMAPGIVVLRRDTLLTTDDGAPRADTLRLARGDTVYVLEYHELGMWTLWYQGRFTEGIEFWNGSAQRFFGRGRDSLAGYSDVGPTTETWLRLRGPGSIEGWWRFEEGAWARPDWDQKCP